jgi:DNA-3-methyladenine glycosylase I
VKLFKRTFRFTGGEIVSEFLKSTGVLPGAHRESCPVYRRVLKQRPMWMEEGKGEKGKGKGDERRGERGKGKGDRGEKENPV